MRRLLTFTFLLPLAIASALVLGPSPAYADTVCQVTDPESGVCLIWVEVPGDPSQPGEPGDDGPKDTGSGQSCFWDPIKQGLTSPPAGPVACTNETGYWSNSYNCYIQLADPQPPASDTFWEGVYLDYGAVYQCSQPQTDLLFFLWLMDPPPGSDTGPSPREVAELAIARMNLRAIDIGIAPEPGDDRMGLVGLPVWLWAADPDTHSYGPITVSASASGITVTATARVRQLTWVMGDGNEVVCHTSGTPYKPIYGKQSSPDCGHTYEESSSNEPGDTFTVTATSDWVITWEGAGQNGTIRLNGMQRSVDIAVGEAQVLVR